MPRHRGKMFCSRNLMPWSCRPCPWLMARTSMFWQSLHRPFHYGVGWIGNFGGMNTSLNRSLKPEYYNISPPGARPLLIPNLLVTLVHTATRARLLPGLLVFNSPGSRPPGLWRHHPRRVYHNVPALSGSSWPSLSTSGRR